MRTLSLFVIFGAILQASASPIRVETRSIDQGLFNDFSRFWIHAVNAYVDNCTFPPETGLVVRSDDRFPMNALGTQGYIARNITSKEIIVAFRGTFNSLYDWGVTNARIRLVDYKFGNQSSQFPYRSTAPEGTKVHEGFLAAYTSVVHLVIDRVRTLLAESEDYTVVTVGHSMGGALASLAAMSIKDNLPGARKIKTYTYGQPRTGNAKYSEWVNNSNHCHEREGQDYFCSYRITHSGDGVPLTPPNLFGYKHHGVEYFQESGGVSASNLKQCGTGSSPDYEDISCLARESFNLGSTLKAHSEYLGKSSSETTCVKKNLDSLAIVADETFTLL